MLHTARFYINLTMDEAYLIERNLGITLDQLKPMVERNFYGITAWVIKKYGIRLFFVIDFVKLLNKSSIEESDYDKAERKIEEFILFLFRDSSFINRICMTRIDYRLDAQIPTEERELLLFLFRKTTSKHRHQKKDLKYKTTLYFNSNSVISCVYDKELEAKEQRGKVEWYEDSVLRLEARILNQHLKYKKYRKGKEKSLREYFKNELFREYMMKYFGEILFSGHYYKITRVRTILNKSQLKDSEKEKLLLFLCEISKHGFDYVESKYSTYYRKKFLKQLNSLNINPILIPKGRKSPSFVKNPFQF
ncbi:phage/plasmid replication domain-containing protein [Niallia sp. FSL W8-0954]|uniref:phage/plasmid replication domain-containing protein n=1 Tax=Niallia sp. FSL W8-0954 TaxID=2975338 RepID=UPI0030F71F2E